MVDLTGSLDTASGIRLLDTIRRWRDHPLENMV